MPHRPAAWLALCLGLALLLVELAMGRPGICPCGVVRFWAGDVQSDQNSQQVADWYSFSHVIHGLIFYGIARALWRWTALGRVLSPRWALPLAVALEGGWELLENSPLIIDRYRSVTISYGYSGDSVLNSLSDVGWMALGFIVAARLPARASVALALVFEAFTLFMIRDNLTLNVLMLVHPIEAVRDWQSSV
nr:DUF2585 domain-containing protein [Novosphingobium resinovorum]